MIDKILTKWESFKKCMVYAHYKHDLTKMMPSHFKDKRINMATLEDLFKQSWLIAYAENDLFVGHILIEWFGDTAEIHICKHIDCDWRKAFEMCIELIKPECKIVRAYIRKDQRHILIMAKLMKFKHRFIESQQLYELTLDLSSV